MPASIPVGWVRISTTDPPMRVTARLSQEQPQVTAGYGGWEEVARPRRSPLTTWKASPGLRMSLPILLDNWTKGLSIEKQIGDIALMARPVASDGEPPQVKIAARGGAIPYQNRTWVVDSIDWGDALMNASGNRVRQQATLSLLEYVEDVYLQERSAANRQRSKAKQNTGKGAPKKRTSSKGGATSSSKKSVSLAKTGLLSGHPFGSGENLARVAARELGDCDRWPEIAALNNLRDPRAVPYGKVIRLP
jgi:hypothetical protein